MLSLLPSFLPSCGYATLHDVTKKTKEDRMESFFLSETCKYLYLVSSGHSHGLPLTCCTVSTPLHSPVLYTHIPIHIHKYPFTHTYIPIHTYTNTHSHIHTYPYTYTNTHSHIHTYPYTYTNTHSHIHTYPFTHTQIPIHTYTHTHTHTQIPIHTYTHTHTLIPIRSYTHTHTHLHSYLTQRMWSIATPPSSCSRRRVT